MSFPFLGDWAFPRVRGINAGFALDVRAWKRSDLRLPPP